MEMQSRNPFQEVDHIEDPPTDLRERILRSATDKRGVLLLAGLFTGSYLSSFLSLVVPKRLDRSSGPTRGDGTNNKQ